MLINVFIDKEIVTTLVCKYNQLRYRTGAVYLKYYLLIISSVVFTVPI